MNGWLETWRHQGQPWEHVWLSSDSGPMKRGERVKFIRLAGNDNMSAIVEHPVHGQQLVGSSGLELPREFKTAKGKWISESDPRVELFLLKALDDLRAGGKKVEASGDPHIRRRTEEELLWLLKRNGWGGEEIKLPGFEAAREQ